jgi:hypothetical protein
MEEAHGKNKEQWHSWQCNQELNHPPANIQLRDDER